MRLIIAGSRDFDDYPLLVEKIQQRFFFKDEFFGTHCIDEIVSGKAKGADSLGEIFAKEFHIPIKEFPAKWKKYGKSAGIKRNRAMSNYADALIVFWDGSSKGTKHMVDCMKNSNKEVHIELFGL